MIYVPYREQIIGINGVDMRGQSVDYVALQLTGPVLSPVVVTLLPGPESRAFYQDVYHRVRSCVCKLS